MTIIPIVIGAFGTVTKGLLKGLEDLEVGGRVETIQTTALLKTARILRRVLETWGDLLSLNLQWKTISLRWCEKLQWVNNNNNNNDNKNLIKGINTWVVPLVRYSRPFLKWTRDEFKQMDQRTRKLMTMHKTLQRRRWQTICFKKRGRRRTCQHRRQRWYIHTTTQKLHRKTRTRTDYSHQKQYW